MPLKTTKNKTTSTIIGKTLLAKQITESLKKKRQSFTQIQVETILGQALEEIKKALISGQELRFPGYLSLKTVVQKPRMAMNLQTGKKMSIPAKRVPKAKFSEDLKKEIGRKK